MSRDATGDLAKLCGLAGSAGAIVGAVWMPLAGVAISSGMLGLLAVALISPAGPTVLFNDGGSM